MLKSRNSTQALSEQASNQDIAEYLGGYLDEQVDGIVNNIKGITHEIYYQHLENTDGDGIKAHLEGQVNAPGSDIILENEWTGETVAVQLKATDFTQYVNEAIEKYPDIEVYATQEVADRLGIQSTGISNGALTREVEETLGELGLHNLEASTQDYVAHYEQKLEMQPQNVNTEEVIYNTLGISLEDLMKAV